MKPILRAVAVIAGCCAFLPLAAALAASAQADASPASSAATIAQLAQAIAWPVTAIVIAAMFQTPLAEFVSTLGGRVNKLSVFKVEIELASASEPASAPLLDYIRTGTNLAPVADSANMLMEQIQSTEPADFSVISLGEGKEWITSRLFIAAVMMERMRGVKAFVFVDHTELTDRHFLAVVSVRELRWLLAMKYPWLEVAMVKAEAQRLQYEVPAMSQRKWVTTGTGAIDAMEAQQMVSAYLTDLQRPSATPGATGYDWTALRNYDERAEWVTRPLLTDLLPSYAFDAAANIPGDAPKSRRARALLRVQAPFVALIDGNERFLRLINREIYLEQVANVLGEEPESASGAK